MPNSNLFLKISAICGILFPIIAIIFISLAVYYSPWFNHTENWYSDIGGGWNERPIYSSRGISSILFNLGLILSGILGTIFAIGLRKSEMIEETIGTKLLIVCVLSLIALGIFPETILIMHIFFGIIFFLTIPFSLIFIGNSLKKSERIIGNFVIILGVISLIAFIFLLRGRAVMEGISVFAIWIFSIIFGVKLFRYKKRGHSPFRLTNSHFLKFLL